MPLESQLSDRLFVSIRVVCVLAMLGALATLTSACGRHSDSDAALRYPGAERTDQLDDYHGRQVADPYRWMEDLEAPAVAAWVEAQNAIARPYLEAIPARKQLIARLTELWDYERIDVPRKFGDRYFYLYNDGTLDHSRLYVSDRPAEGGEPLLDPNSFSSDATVALAGLAVSPDGRRLAYAKSDGGTDWRNWYVRDVASGKDLSDVIAGTKFTTPSWLPDGSGFYYSRYPANGHGAFDDQQQVRVFYHEIGTGQADDRLVYEVTDHPTRNPYVEVSDDGRYLILTLWDGYEANGVAVRDLAAGEDTFTPLFEDWQGLYYFLGNAKSALYFLTTRDAPRGRVIALAPGRPDPGDWRDVVPQAEAPIESATLVGDEIIVTYLKDVKSLVQRYGTDGEFRADVELPGNGTAAGFEEGSDESETFFSFSTFTRPPSIYRIDLDQDNTEALRSPEIDFDPDDYSAEQVFFNSKDGTLIPMFIVHRKGVTRDGNRPTLLYGYGGFNVSLTPSFEPSRIVWLQMGGVLAIPNLRGGGEYGEAWHRAGTRLDKQNVFDDFIAAAEWLIAADYTRPSRLAIIGRSNGGLLVGATMTQRPELFGVALPAVGVLDMLRYHTASANAKAWSSDYGLSSNAEEFEALIAYSPYHNVRQGVCYPPTLITTADLDDRVVPWHSYKFGAALQFAQSCDNPVLIRVETRAGHGAGKPKWMNIEDYADQWAFLIRHLGME